MDLGLLVDSSSAVDWTKMQGLLKGYVGTRNISPDDDHVGIVTFASSSSVDLAFPMSSSPDYTKGRIWQAIDELKQQGGNDRRIDLGLETVSSGLFGPHTGARKDARQVKKKKATAKTTNYQRKAHTNLHAMCYVHFPDMFCISNRRALDRNTYSGFSVLIFTCRNFPLFTRKKISSLNVRFRIILTARCPIYHPNPSF